ncbi:MAG: hypothetical protein WCY86_08190 [Spirosomataceae bacterium]
MNFTGLETGSGARFEKRDGYTEQYVLRKLRQGWPQHPWRFF